MEPESRERKRREVQHREIGRENRRNREQTEKEKEQHRENGRENGRNREKGEKMDESNRYEKTVRFSRGR